MSDDGCIYPASVFDPISARIAESVGFKLTVLAGSLASRARLGAPDVVVITLPELAQLSNRARQAARVPLLVDADHGYDNAINVNSIDLAQQGVGGNVAFEVEPIEQLIRLFLLPHHRNISASYSRRQGNQQISCAARGSFSTASEYFAPRSGRRDGRLSLKALNLNPHNREEPRLDAISPVNTLVARLELGLR